jgi:hypothetical protein
MSTPTPTTTQKAAATPTGKGKAAPVQLRPFFTGTLDLETHTYKQTGTISANPQTMPTYNVRTNGWLDNLWVSLVVTTASNAATTAYQEDAPANAISSITFSDSGGQPIIGPMSGWELAEFVKMGGFSYSDDYKQSQTYSATTGSGGTGGSFQFVIQIPITFVRREPLGPLPNTNNNTAFTVDITLNSTGNIYSTAPTNPGTFSLEIWQDAYRQSAGKDAQKNPTVTDVPGKGATLYLLRSTVQGLLPGSPNFEISKQTGSYRALGFVLRDSTPTRSQGEADWFDPLRVHLNNDVPYDRTKRHWVRKLERQYGYVNSNETAGGRSNGSYWLPFMDDGGFKVGNENRYRYWNISAADTIALDGTLNGSGSHSLTLMYNFVAPPGGNIKALTNK